MTDPFAWSVVSAASLAGLIVVTVAALKGWRDWIALQRLSVEGNRTQNMVLPGNPGARIELADMRERIRKLEAIAAGVDL